MQEKKLIMFLDPRGHLIMALIIFSFFVFHFNSPQDTENRSQRKRRWGGGSLLQLQDIRKTIEWEGLWFWGGGGSRHIYTPPIPAPRPPHTHTDPPTVWPVADPTSTTQQPVAEVVGSSQRAGGRNSVRAADKQLSGRENVS